MEYLLNLDRRLSHLLTMPFIYAIFFAILFLDICIELYQHICFPVYRIPLVPRGEYIRIDRHKLQYLNIFQKMNCMYCGYVNGFLRYAVEIGAKTEQYWCAIKHKEMPEKSFRKPKHQEAFMNYDDKETFNNFKNK
jgi:hypothetical protein